MSLKNEILTLAQNAKKAALVLALVPTATKNQVLKKMARLILAKADYIIKENNKDLIAAERQGYPQALIDRLTLNQKRINEMAQSLFKIAKLRDPVGETIATFKRPNGLCIKKVRTPIGVIAIVYESRPNVASDCIGLCLKSGNVVILKGGREAFYSNRAIFHTLQGALKGTKIPKESINMIDSTNRAAVSILLDMNQYVDLVIPRGGEGLIRFVSEHSRIPAIKHYKGICHTYVSDKANLEMARRICFNAKVQRPGVCNAMETMLVHRNIAARFLPVMIQDFKQAGVEIRGCPITQRIIKEGIKKAKPKDWDTEYLDLILSVRVVRSLKEAIDHINTHGSQHSETIVTKDRQEAEIFFKSVDSACLYLNASTRFTDGYQYGFGAEIGISTGKLHARGPMALDELTTYKYTVIGQGQIRT